LWYAYCKWSNTGCKQSKTGGGNDLGAKKKLTEWPETIKAFEVAFTKLDLPPGPGAVKTSTTQGRFFKEKLELTVWVGMAWEQG